MFKRRIIVAFERIWKNLLWNTKTTGQVQVEQLVTMFLKALNVAHDANMSKVLDDQWSMNETERRVKGHSGERDRTWRLARLEQMAAALLFLCQAANWPTRRISMAIKC